MLPCSIPFVLSSSKNFRLSYNFKVGTISDPLHVKSGVPQASILEPLLFSIYTSLMGTYIQYCKCDFYTDGTQLYYFFYLKNLNQANESINADLVKVSSFYADRGLILNCKKSSAIGFDIQSRRQRALDLKLNYVSLKFSHTVNGLGVLLDQELRFRENINKLIRKAYASFKILFSSIHLLNTNVMRCFRFLIFQLL